MASDIKVAVGRFECPTGTGNANLTISGLGWTPKAALFLGQSAVSAANPVAYATGCIGAAVSTSQRSLIGWTGIDGQATTSTGRIHGSDNCARVYPLNYVGGSRTEADFVAWISDGVTLDFHTVGAARYLTIIFFGGADLQAAVVNTQTSTQDTGVDVTTVGFQPNLLFAFGCGATSLTAGDDQGHTSHMIISFGVASDETSLSQKGVGISSPNAKADETVSSIVWSDGLCGQIHDDAESFRTEVSDFDSQGYTLTAKDGTGANKYHTVLALDTGDRKTWVDILDVPTSGNLSTTAPGFKPQAYGVIGTGAQANDTIETDADGGVFNWGCADGTREFSANFSLEDAEATSDTQNESRSNVLSQEADDGASTLYRGSHSSFDASGFTVSMSTSPAAARKAIFWAIEEAASPGHPPRPVSKKRVLDRHLAYYESEEWY